MAFLLPLHKYCTFHFTVPTSSREPNAHPIEKIKLFLSFGTSVHDAQCESTCVVGLHELLDYLKSNTAVVDLPTYLTITAS